ncbi:MAG TPA: CCA tRNA nucleotidyltransferase [Terriglobales bacterium]|jgi:tRNA nucleotidyltransferase/poly(A) polymerase|nr:CCA tRNA nucleotidyltransferase [Terriglobales bacterium]
MADYIYTMETRLTPEQQRAVSLVQDVARAQEMNLYLTGGTIRDIISGFLIRDIDLTVQGNPLRLQKDLEKAGVMVEGVDDDTKTLYVLFPGNVRGEIGMTHSAAYDKPGKPPRITPATTNEDLRRRDFTVNAMALSLNPGSRGLLLDPFNGVADIEAKVIRILHNYAFLEEPSRLIRATRFAHRFHWPLEERTQARYDAAKEGNYIDNVTDRAIAQETESLAYEEDPLHIMRALEKENWLKVLNPRWSVAKVDSAGLSQLLKTRQQMQEFGYNVDMAPAVMYFLTRRLSDSDIRDMQKLNPRRQFVESWRNLEEDAKKLAKRLTGKEAATPSRTWNLLSEAKPETILFLDATSRQQSVSQKLKNFFGKWRQVRQKLPLPEMAELHITPQLPAYPKIEQEAFLLLLDGKLRSRTEILKFLKPYAPPPPPPPPPPKKGKGAKAEPAPAAASAVPAKKGKGKGKAAMANVEVPAAKVEKPSEKPPVKAAKPAPKPAKAKPAPAKKPKKRKR